MASPAPGQLEEVRRRWDLQGELAFIRRVENFVYEGRAAGRPLIVRFTEPSHRAPAEVEAEVHWMEYLAQGGLRVARPVPSLAGRLVETLAGEAPFVATVFEKAPGRTLDIPDELTPEMLGAWGAFLGAMHRLSVTYITPPHVEPRRNWDQDDGLVVALRGLDPADGAPHDVFVDLLEQLAALPREPGSFGLAHCDLHHGNFFVDDGLITAFDFDDSCRHWYAYDLMVPFFNILGELEDLGRRVSLPGLLAPFLAGYRREHVLEPAWEHRLPLFLEFRVALLYHWIKVRVGEGLFTGRALEWCRRRSLWCADLLSTTPPGANVWET